MTMHQSRIRLEQSLTVLNIQKFNSTYLDHLTSIAYLHIVIQSFKQSNAEETALDSWPSMIVSFLIHHDSQFFSI